MGIFKKIALRIGLVLSIVVVSNYIYEYTFYKSDIRENGLLTEKLNHGIENSDILYFSASPNKAYPKGDIDTRSISKIVDDQLINHSVTSIDTGAIHAGVFLKLIKLIPNDNDLKYILVNMNYRSFGVQWIMSSLENAISKQSVFYANRPLIINRFLQGLNYYNAIPKKERQRLIQSSWANEILPLDSPKNTVTNWCKVEKWGDWTNPKRNLADHYIKNYAFTLNENNPRIKDFDEIVKICKQKNIPVIFNILGENITNAEYLIDSDLTTLMIKNKDFLKHRYLEKGVTVVDNFELIPDSCFYERDYPTEHYSFAGRQIIGDNIAKEILKFEQNN
jgi:hypothetical protein